MKKIIKRLKMWFYWRKKYSTENFGTELLILFGLKKPPLSFDVLTPLVLFIDKVEKGRLNNE